MAEVCWQRSVDCVVGGYSGKSLLLGMHGRGGLLHFVGATVQLGHLKESPAFIEWLLAGDGPMRETAIRLAVLGYLRWEDDR